jgi:hypothetical protein
VRALGSGVVWEDLDDAPDGVRAPAGAHPSQGAVRQAEQPPESYHPIRQCQLYVLA